MAYEDWTTISGHQMKLYTTKASENFEFIIDNIFQNPFFMVYFNKINYRGTICGIAPYVEQVSGLRYRVVPRIRTTKKIIKYFFPSATPTQPQSFTVNRIPYTRRIFITGQLKMDAMNNGRVDIKTETKNFNGVNLNEGYIQATYWWGYTVPETHFKTGEQFTYTLTQIRKPNETALDTLQVIHECDRDYVEDGKGNLIDNGWVYKNAENSELTILVVEKGLQE